MQKPWPTSKVAKPADFAHCRRTLRNGSRSFHAASFLFPKSVREPASALYAFCRLADDAVDVGGGGREALRRLSGRLDRVYAGRPLPHPVDRAFADVAARFAVPKALPEALLEGLEWDVENRRYETLAELNAYAARVAGTVGAMMALVMGARTPPVLARACDLGVAMQLTNIARDVGEDARNGRLYLPLAWLREAGLDPEAWLARPSLSLELAAVVRRLLRVADALYARAASGIAALPPGRRMGTDAARLLYAEIGHEVARNDWDCVTRRAVVSGGRKITLLLRVSLTTGRLGTYLDEPCLDESRFLVDAVAAMTPPSVSRPSIPWWNLREQAVFAIELFERLERRERMSRSGHVALRVEGSS